jgi:hypothetical protein
MFRQIRDVTQSRVRDADYHLGYFRSLIDEIDQLNGSPDYWQYVIMRLADLERRWRRQLTGRADTNWRRRK